MSDDKKILLIDEYKEPLKLMESVSTPSGEPNGAVLATLFGTLSDFSQETRNGRWYSKSLWTKVMNDELFKEALDNRSLFGESDHPMDIENRIETHIPYVSHIVRDPKINESKQCVEGYIDVLDTPNGRIIKTLLDYGCTIGVSSRGTGDLTSVNGKTMVDENTYDFVTWDIVARPSNKKARVHEIDTVDVSTGKSAFESLKSQINFMIENNDKSNLKLTEAIISKTDIPDKDNILNMIKESLEDKVEVKDEDEVKIDQSDLDEAYGRILELKSVNADLVNKNKSLARQLDESRHTNRDLESLNKNLNSMVKSYMDMLSDVESSNKNTKEIEIDDEGTKQISILSNDLTDKYKKLVDLTTKTYGKVNDSLSEVISKLNQSIEDKDFSSEVNDMRMKLDNASQEISKLKESLSLVTNENKELHSKISKVTNEYFKVRCSQFGINESIARVEFNDRLTDYDLEDINEVLSDMYKSGKSKVNESCRSSEKLGSLKLTGSVNSNSKIIKSQNESVEETDEDTKMLIESIRQVKIGGL